MITQHVLSILKKHKGEKEQQLRQEKWNNVCGNSNNDENKRNNRYKNRLYNNDNCNNTNKNNTIGTYSNGNDNNNKNKNSNENKHNNWHNNCKMEENDINGNKLMRFFGVIFDLEDIKSILQQDLCNNQSIRNKFISIENLQKIIEDCLCKRLSSLPAKFLECLKDGICMHNNGSNSNSNSNGNNTRMTIDECIILNNRMGSRFTDKANKYLCECLNCSQYDIDRSIVEHRLNVINSLFGNFIPQNEINNILLLFCIRNNIFSCKILLKIFETLKFKTKHNSQSRKEQLIFIENTCKQRNNININTIRNTNTSNNYNKNNINNTANSNNTNNNHNDNNNNNNNRNNWWNNRNGAKNSRKYCNI